MNPGYVYILTNDAMPGLVKIGRTSRDVDLRASELWQTGVPQRFEVFASFKTPDCVQLEAYAHAALSQYRISRSREFFKVDELEAEEAIRWWIEWQAWEFGQQYFEEMFGYQIGGEECPINMAVAPFREFVSGGTVNDLAQKMGQKPRIIADAMERLTVEEIRSAVFRAIEDDRKDKIDSMKRAGIPEEEWEGLLDE